MNIIEFTSRINSHDVKFHITAPADVTPSQFQALIYRAVIETIDLERKLRA